MADDSHDHITAREFDKFTEAITSTILDGFGGLNSRLDKVNGHLERHDVAIGQLTTRSAEQGVLLGEHKRKLDRIDTATGPRHAADPTPPALPAVPLDGESLSIKMTPKVWVVLAGAGGMLFSQFMEWLKQRLAQP